MIRITHRKNIRRHIFMPTMQNIKATVDIRTCEMIQSNLPKKQSKLALAWAELHQEELMAGWKLVL